MANCNFTNARYFQGGCEVLTEVVCDKAQIEKEAESELPPLLSKLVFKESAF